MANHKSAEKASRQAVKRNAQNKSRMTRIRNYVKKVLEAVVAKDKPAADQALVTAQSEMMRGVNKNIIKLNTASRKISRLSAKVKALKQ